MTDKEILTTIKAKAEKLHSQLLRGACSSQVAMETRCKEEAYNEVLAILDNMQEEPVCKDLEEAAITAANEDMQGRQIMEESNENRQLYSRIFRRGFKTGANWQREKDESTTEDLGEYINELSKQFPEVSFAKLSRIAVRVSRWQRTQDTKNKLPNVLNRTDLDEFAYQCAYDMSNDWAIDNPTWNDVEDACKLGAKWQKEQDQSTIELAEDHAMFAGMEKMKEEMMTKSIEAVVSQVPCSNEIILYNPSSVDKYYLPQEMNKLGLNKGDKIKLVIIKED